MYSWASKYLFRQNMCDVFLFGIVKTFEDRRLVAILERGEISNPGTHRQNFFILLAKQSHITGYFRTRTDKRHVSF